MGVISVSYFTNWSCVPQVHTNVSLWIAQRSHLLFWGWLWVLSSEESLVVITACKHQTIAKGKFLKQAHGVASHLFLHTDDFSLLAWKYKYFLKYVSSCTLMKTTITKPHINKWKSWTKPLQSIKRAHASSQAHHCRAPIHQHSLFTSRVHLKCLKQR